MAETAKTTFHFILLQYYVFKLDMWTTRESLPCNYLWATERETLLEKLASTLHPFL